jgi:hypothetical protein
MMRAGLLIASLAVLAACNLTANAQEGRETASGERTQRSYDLAGFDSVGLGGRHDVIVSVGHAHSVRAEGPSDVLDRLEVFVEGGNLEIRDEKRGWSSRNNGDRPKATIYVTVPALKAVAIGGSGNIRIDRVRGDSFAASIGGSGNIDVQTLDVRSADFSIAGSGDIRATGRAGRSNISIAGSGDAQLDGVESRNASVSIVGSGNAGLRSAGNVDVSIMGSGDVRVEGGGKCRVSKVGSGSVQCQG